MLLGKMQNLLYLREDGRNIDDHTKIDIKNMLEPEKNIIILNITVTQRKHLSVLNAHV
jgi:hypothetical protein